MRFSVILYIRFQVFLNTFWGFFPIPYNREGPAAAHLRILLYQKTFDLNCFLIFYLNAIYIGGECWHWGKSHLHTVIPGGRGAYQNFDGLVLCYNFSPVILSQLRCSRTSRLRRLGDGRPKAVQLCIDIRTSVNSICISCDNPKRGHRGKPQ